MPSTSETTAWALLQGQQFMNLFTYRKTGEAVKTPVWFAQRGEKLYVTTTMSAGKIKRIRNNSRVLVGPADRSGRPLGPTSDGQARVLSASEASLAKDALDDKYGLFKAVFDFFGTVRGIDRAYIEITPVER
ncbi:MAG: PPOX class F420-dependent oxidoreductase [Oscillochloris sp.]|nr:PPOX class F420-dependent oxidoreductase [Oscillochloris sp.]